MLLKRYILISILTSIAFAGHSQDYKNAIQASFGTYWGASYKRMITQEQGAIASIQNNEHSLLLTALRIFDQPAFPHSSSKWFFSYGYGVHLAYHSQIESKNIFRPFSPTMAYKGHFISPGMDGYIGLEYRFLKYPFTLSTDFIPNFEFFGPGYFRVNMNNISIKASIVF